MKKYTALLFTLFLASCGNSQPSPAVNRQDIGNTGISKAQAELIFDHAKVFPDGTQLSIALLRNGETDYYGIQRENDTLRTVDNHRRVFEIGSISKVFTSTLLAGLVEEGKVGLDDPINDHLDFPMKDNQQITFRALANHTSGLPRLPSNLNLFFVDRKNPYKTYDEGKLKEYLSEKMELSDQAGKKSEYSNLGAGLLGYTLSKIEKKTYQDLLKERICDKYRMANTTTDRIEVEKMLVKGRDPEGEETSNWDLNVLVGAGGILSNVEDLSKFAQAQFDDSNQELNLARKKTFDGGNRMDAGLGWAIIKHESKDPWHWHNGGTGGYSSSMAVDTKNKYGVIILSNVSAFGPKMGNIDLLCFALMDTLQEKVKKD